MSEIIINRNNFDLFKEINPYVIEIKWKNDELVKEILELFPNVILLNCYFNKITSLEPLSNLTSLTHLHLTDNQILSLEPLSNLTSLTHLDFFRNYVTSIEPLRNLTSLTHLIFWENEVTSLEPLSNLTSLTYLSFTRNQIRSLEPLSNLTSLTHLFFSRNQVTSIEPLRNLTSLTHLNFWENEVTSLEPLSNLTSLTYLSFTRNQVISLEPIIYLRNLQYLYNDNNPLEPPSIRVQRFLNRYENMYNKTTVYSDTQNVHNTTIQRSVMDSVNNLMKDNKPEFTLDDIVNSNLQETTKTALIEYCQDKDYHCILLLTYQELLSYVWSRIIKSPHKTELFKILEEAISDTLCKCFTGRFNRTLSVLCGFYDDIKVEISDNDRISAIILLSKNEITPYTPEKHRELATIRLKEAGYDDKTISMWVEYIE